VLCSFREGGAQSPGSYLRPGQFGSLTRTLGRAEVQAFADLTGDDNPVHLDAEYAGTTKFKRPIAHGLLAASMIPTIFGAQFTGAIYMQQTFQFKAPIFVGDTVTTTVKVTKVREVPYIVTCSTTIENQEGVLCTTGEATVMLPQPPKEDRS
jgi:acyl dehydratase